VRRRSVLPASGTGVRPADVIGVFKPDDLAVIKGTKGAATLKPAKFGNSDDVEIGDQQAALVLVDMLGYPVGAAAEIIGVSERTVKSRAVRGRARLGPKLAHLRPAAIPSQDRWNRSAGPHVLLAQEGSDHAP
jgi:predicted DNA-binding protein (UPF0251 family)